MGKYKAHIELSKNNKAKEKAEETNGQTVAGKQNCATDNWPNNGRGKTNCAPALVDKDCQRKIKSLRDKWPNGGQQQTVQKNLSKKNKAKETKWPNSGLGGATK